MSGQTGVPTPSILQKPDITQSVVLSSGVGQAFDVPAGMGYAGFSMNADFWVRYGSTAAVVPTTSSSAGTTSAELNPTYRNLSSTAGTTGFSMVSDFGAKGSINWYKP